MPPRLIKGSQLAGVSAFAVLLLLVGGVILTPFLNTRTIWRPRPGLVCPAGEHADFQAIRAQADEAAGLDEHFGTRRYGRLPSVALWEGRGFGGGETELVAERSGAGRWTVVGSVKSVWPTETERAVDAQLEDRSGRRLEEILGDPCLYEEPRHIGSTYPTPSGETATCVDGRTTALDIDFMTRRRRSVQDCWPHGLSGEVAGILRAAASEANSG